MKAEAQPSNSKLPRRSWLAALAASAGFLTARKSLARPAVTAKATDGGARGAKASAEFSDEFSSERGPSLVVKPAPDAVKRHG
jgi:hypothetical protein